MELKRIYTESGLNGIVNVYDNSIKENFPEGARRAGYFDEDCGKYRTESNEPVKYAFNLGQICVNVRLPDFNLMEDYGSVELVAVIAAPETGEELVDLLKDLVKSKSFLVSKGHELDFDNIGHDIEYYDSFPVNTVEDVDRIWRDMNELLKYMEA